MPKRVSKKDDDKLFAFLGIFLTIIGYIIAIGAKKDTDYVKFYCKQGIVILIIWIIAAVINIIPVLGQIIYLISAVLLFVAWIIGMFYSLSGEKKEIPIIGELAKKF